MSKQMAAKLCFLSKHHLFQDFSPSQIEQLARKTTRLTYQPGRHLYRAGQIGQRLFILQKGRVDLYRLTPQGRKLIVRTLGAGAVFGEMALIGNKIYEAFAVSVTRSYAYVIGNVEVYDFMRQIPNFALRLIEFIGGCLKDSERRLEQMAFLGTPSRLANLLLDMSGRDSEIGGYSHQEFSFMIGVYRETVSITLRTFKKLGLIDMSRLRIHILDRQGLEKIVAQNMYLTKKNDIKLIKSQLGKE